MKTKQRALLALLVAAVLLGAALWGGDPQQRQGREGR